MSPYEKFAAKAFERFGNTFSYSNYVGGSHPKVTVTCNLHGGSVQYTSNHLRGSGCAKCFADTKRDSLESFLPKAEKAHSSKYLYIGLSYVGRVCMINYLCPKHGFVTQRAGNHLQGRECAECGHEARVSSLSFTLEEVLAKLPEDFKSKFTYGSIFVESGSRYISYTCKHGKIKQLLESHLAGKHPKCCDAESRLREPDYQKFLDQLKVASPEIDFTYEGRGLNHHAPMFSFVCETHGSLTMDGYHLLKGYRCVSCTRTSKPAEGIAAYIGSLGFEVQFEYLVASHRGRYDLYVPAAKLLIEYHGVYWHSSKFKKPSAHEAKQKAALAQGYACMQIFEDEWLYKQNQVKRLIASRLGRLELAKVDARKCEVVAVDHSEASLFYTDNHIQGACAPSKYYGLSYQGSLVAVAAFTFRLSRRATAEDCAELLRYASSATVRGGLGKLQAAFLKDFPGVSELVSFSDDRLFSGSLYERLGYKVSAKLSADYTYYDPKISNLRQHKSKYQKSRLAKRFPTVDTQSLTEQQITQAAGIHRIYDAGKTRWSFSVNP